MLLLVIWSCWLHSFFLFQGDNQGLYRTDNGKIVFLSKAPLETITASSESLKGVIDTSTSSFAFTVSIKTFKGFNSKLQLEHFHENYLESEKFPNATFTGKIIEDIDFSQDGSYTVRAKGSFTIHGVKQERLIKTKLEIKNNVIIASSDFMVELEDHDISIPRIVQQKISPEIEISVNAVLNPVKAG